MILQCVSSAPWSWGRASLTHILRADKKAPPRAQGSSGWGVLAFRSATAIEHMLDGLEHAGLLSARSLDHGGVVLDLTPAGRAALQDPARLENLLKLGP